MHSLTSFLAPSTVYKPKMIDRTIPGTSLKRPAFPADHIDQPHAQIARSAINQSANTKQIKPTKSIVNMRSISTSAVNRGALASTTKAPSLNKSVNGKPPPSKNQAPTVEEVKEKDPRPATAMGSGVRRPARKGNIMVNCIDRIVY